MILATGSGISPNSGKQIIKKWVICDHWSYMTLSFHFYIPSLNIFQQQVLPLNHYDTSYENQEQIPA
ncbi:MAG: hypothetical protein A2277_10055 [Desulfobacterales bacterium RIFOXYA12_FULL_46_15]|nr:MAG: hypothetical protein A2277_10055 [Desulfobacterales bacterium RIFOXYA12_FULL_46_15]